MRSTWGHPTVASAPGASTTGIRFARARTSRARLRATPLPLLPAASASHYESHRAHVAVSRATCAPHRHASLNVMVRALAER